jgi:type IV secretion system protein VirD4
MSNVRSRAIHISFFFQSIGQLQNRYPDSMGARYSAVRTLCWSWAATIRVRRIRQQAQRRVTIYADTVMKQANIFMPSMLQPNYRHSEERDGASCSRWTKFCAWSRKTCVMLRGQQILEIEKFDYTRNPESCKFRPIPIQGLKDMPQYSAESGCVSQPPRRAGGAHGGQSPSREVRRDEAERNRLQSPQTPRTKGGGCRM